MALIVRDEADIIAANLAHHFGAGVDEVAVIDNGSTDGTKDILADWAGAAPVTVIHRDGVLLDQQGWYNELAGRALEAGFGGAVPEWMIFNDADEFYEPCAGTSLTAALAAAGAARMLRCGRRHLLASPGEIAQKGWAEALRWHAELPHPPPHGHGDPEVPLPYPFFYYRLAPKIVVRSGGLQAIGSGAHKAWMEGDPTPVPGVLKTRHYPARSAQEFLASCRAFHAVAEAGDGPRLRHSKYRRWGRMLADGAGEAAVLGEVYPSRARIVADSAAGLIRRWNGTAPDMGLTLGEMPS